MDVEKAMKPAKQECPICFYVHTLEVQCDECNWKCCDICATKWAKEHNTCMICKKELFEQEVTIDGMSITYNPRRQMLKCVLQFLDTFSALAIFCLGINFIVLPEEIGSIEMVDIFMVSVIAILLVLLIRFTCKHVATALCIPSATDYDRFENSDSD